MITLCLAQSNSQKNKKRPALTRLALSTQISDKTEVGENVEYLIIALLAMIFIGPFAIYGGYILWREVGREKIRRDLTRYRFKPDQLGNYETYFDPATDIAYRPRPGNKAFPDPQPQPAPVYQNLPIAKKEPTRPLIITYPRPPQLEESERSIEPNVQDDDDVRGLLTEAKNRGIGKEKAIREYTGVTKGGSKGWRELSELWDKL